MKARDDPASHTTIFDVSSDGCLDPALARLAFGSRPPRRSGAAATGVGPHLAFLPMEALEIDLGDPQQRSFGDYELLELLGQGGMGVVYRARQASLDRDVAVKLLSAGPWASRDFIGRFQREAQAAARMQHPNIVAIHEIGAHEEMNFFSMQLVRGGTLSDLLVNEGALAPRRAAELLRTIAEAVDYAHRLDVLHLDLKPGNVLLDEAGQPHVADFGLARRLGEQLAVDAGEVSGTPSYMAPEQAQALPQGLSAATDIYGLGAILYECLAGRPPFACGSAQRTLQSVVADAPPSLQAARPGVPADLEAICLKCLAKDPAARYRGARALAADLGRFLDGREVHARPLGVGGRALLFAHREPWLSAMVSLLFFSLVFGISATALQWKRAERSAAASSALLWDSRREEAVRLQADGLGFEAMPRLLANIAEQEAAGADALPALERRRLGMLTGQGAVLVDHTVIADASPLALAMSPDGRLLAVALSDQSVRWYDSATLAERGRVDLRGKESANGVPAVPRLLRFVDDRRLRVTLDWYANLTSPFDGDSWLVDLDSGVLVEPPKAFPGFADAVYSADGKFALLRDRAHRAQLWQVDPWRAIASPGPPAEQYTPWLLGPKARYAVFLETGLKAARLFTLPDLTHPRDVSLPGNAGISAWSRSEDGRWLALGDFEGRVFLVSTAPGGDTRLLPTPRSREVSWTEFSEDGAWLAVGTRDGTAYAFDVATGNPLVSGQMQQAFAVVRVGISRRHRLLVAAGQGETALWRLPEPGPRAVPAQRIAAAPLGHRQAGDYASAWSLQSGLFASVGLDGHLRVWRLPAGPTPPALAARQIPERTSFDGHRLVDVAGESIRVVTPQGRGLTPWRHLEQAPGFAELVGNGDRLVASVGTRLLAFDSKGLSLRGAPIDLPASPERWIVDSLGHRLVLSFSRNGEQGFTEDLRTVDLNAWRLLPPTQTLAAPLRHLAFSSDGLRLLAVGPASAATTVMDATTLTVVGEFPHDEFQPVAWADFDADRVLLATRAVDPRLGTDAVLEWDPTERHPLRQRDASAAAPLGVIATAGGPFLAGTAQDWLDPGGAHPRSIARHAATESTAVLATSHDGRLVAHAFRREVQVIDAVSGATLGPPLQADSDANDVIVQLAFSTDARQLLARTLQGHWRVWPLAPRNEPAAELRAGLAHAVGDAGAGGVVRMPGNSERRALRAADPGPWLAPEPPPPSKYLRIGEMAVPMRHADASRYLVDLSRDYTSDPEQVRNPFYNVRSQLRPLPVGLQRYDGVDYDLRGMVQLSINRSRNELSDPSSHEQLLCLPLAPVPTAALHLLVQVSTPVPVPARRPLIAVRLHYLDGSSEVLPARSEHELPGFNGRDGDVPMALATDASLVAFGGADPGLSTPTLENPRPERVPRCLDLRPASPINAVLLFAVTQQPAPGPAVIAEPVLRSNPQASTVGTTPLPPAPRPPRPR